jgi:hypothetical protein
MWHSSIMSSVYIDPLGSPLLAGLRRKHNMPIPQSPLVGSPAAFAMECLTTIVHTYEQFRLNVVLAFILLLIDGSSAGLLGSTPLTGSNCCQREALQSTESNNMVPEPVSTFAEQPGPRCSNCVSRPLWSTNIIIIITIVLLQAS